MPTVRINEIPYDAHDGERLSALLARLGIAADHPCGGRGTCQKCTVTVNGHAELSCQYILCAGDEITLAPPAAIIAEGEPVGAAASATPADAPPEHALSPAACDLALDLGTTTLALAAIDRATGAIRRVVTANNPQRAFGADIMSRIDYARQNGVAPLQAPLCTAIDRLIDEMLDFTTLTEKYGIFEQESSTKETKEPEIGTLDTTLPHNAPEFDRSDVGSHDFTTLAKKGAFSGADSSTKETKAPVKCVSGTTPLHNAPVFDRLYVAGNTTMLHLLLGIDPTPMGTAPYTAAFLDERRLPATDLGLSGVREVIALPGIAAFVGADLVAGAYHVGRPPAGQYRLLVDLGTNAEILLMSHDAILCTAAAAGPCFEGASISCGMSATPGAICAYESDGTYETIPAPDGTDTPPRGLCGTGLVDVVAALLDREVIDETGYMEQDIFYIADAVSITQEDIRRYQLAKSAVAAAIEALLHTAGVDSAAVDRLCIAGGFAAKLNTASAVRTGLLPAPLADRCVPVGNASLAGTARYIAALAASATPTADLNAITSTARYLDLAADPYFSERFMEGMLFE